MPIDAEYPEHYKVQDEIQNILNTYGPELLKKSLEDLGLSFETKIAQEREPITIGEAIERFFNDADEDSPIHLFVDTTIKTYQSTGNLFLKFCEMKGEVLISKVMTPDFLEEFLGNAQKTSTRNKKASFIRTLIKTICFDYIDSKRLIKLLSKNGVLEIREIDDGTPKYFKPDQMQELFELSKFTRSALRNHAIVWTLVGSAIRVDELHFQIKDIDVKKGTILVYPKRSKKTKRKRYINQNALQVLMNYIEFTFGLPDERYEAHKYGELFVFDCCNSTVQYMIRNLISKAKTIPAATREYYSAHSFRHTFAVNALLSGIDIVRISKYLGHKNISTTQIYLNLFHDDLKKAMEKMPYSNIKISYLKETI